MLRRRVKAFAISGTATFGTAFVACAIIGLPLACCCAVAGFLGLYVGAERAAE